MQNDIKHHLEELGMNGNEVKTYTALVQLGEAPASHVAKKANLPRTTVISILDKFKKDNLISTHRYKGVTFYWIESPKVLSEQLLNKVSIAEELTKLFSGLYRSEASFPYAEIHDTKSGIRKFIEKTLSNLKMKSIIYTIDTPSEGNYNKIFPENVENIILSQKRKRSIATHTLVPHGTLKDILPYKIKNQSIVIKELPSEIRFRGSLWIIEDTIIHFSGNPPFVVALKHEQITLGMKSMFDFFWNRN